MPKVLDDIIVVVNWGDAAFSFKTSIDGFDLEDGTVTLDADQASFIVERLQHASGFRKVLDGVPSHLFPGIA